MNEPLRRRTLREIAAEVAWWIVGLPVCLLLCVWVMAHLVVAFHQLFGVPLELSVMWPISWFGFRT